MVKFNTAGLKATVLMTACLVAAHPGEHYDHEEVHAELARRDLHAATIKRGLDACANHPNFLALRARGETRRAQKAEQLRRARGIDASVPYKSKRDLTALESFETVNHNLTTDGYTMSTSASTLFANYKNVSCILSPEVTIGPYYVSGEYVRSDVVDGQEGVPIHLEYQYIDVSTCDVATGLYLDTWHANATGVYSGIQSSGNGNSNDAANLQTTFLRGVQAVDSDGVAAFDTIFPGHYQGRATHIHLVAHQGGQVFSNGTYVGSTVSHIGQLFFQTDLQSAVEATYPYNTNTQTITTNDEDMWAPSAADNSYDPIPDYVYLGKDISDGLLMWISVGIDMSADYTASAAGALTANGTTSSGSAGSMGSSSGGGGGNMTMPSGGAGGNGTMPSGSFGGGMSGSGAPPSSTSMASSASSIASAVTSSRASSSAAPSAVSSSAKSSSAASSSAAATFTGASSSSSKSSTGSSVLSAGTSGPASYTTTALSSSKSSSAVSSSSVPSIISSTTKTSASGTGSGVASAVSTGASSSAAPPASAASSSSSVKSSSASSVKSSASSAASAAAVTTSKVSSAASSAKSSSSSSAKSSSSSSAKPSSSSSVKPSSSSSVKSSSSSTGKSSATVVPVQYSSSSTLKTSTKPTTSACTPYWHMQNNRWVNACAEPQQTQPAQSWNQHGQANNGQGNNGHSGQRGW